MFVDFLWQVAAPCNATWGKVCREPWRYNLHFHTSCTSLLSVSANLLSVTRFNVSFRARGFCCTAPAVSNSLPSNVCSGIALATPEISSFSSGLYHSLATHLCTCIRSRLTFLVYSGFLLTVFCSSSITFVLAHYINFVVSGFRQRPWMTSVLLQLHSFLQC